MALFARHASGLRLERMQASPQYGGEGFINTYAASTPRAVDMSIVHSVHHGSSPFRKIGQAHWSPTQIRMVRIVQ